MPLRLGELARTCLKLLLKLARVRLELLFRCRARAGRPTLRSFHSVSSSAHGKDHLFGVRKHAPNGRDQTLEVNRFRVELVPPRGDGLLAFAGQRVRGHADDWDVLGLRIVLETPHGFPTI